MGMTRRTFLKLAGGAVGAAALGALGFGTYQNRDRIPFLRKEIVVPPTFDNAQVSGAIGSNNEIKIDAATLDKVPTLPSVATPKHDIYLLTPFQNIPSGVNIAYNKNFGGDFNPGELSNAKDQNIKNNIIFENVPKDTVIIAPFDGQIEFYANPSDAAGVCEMANLFYFAPDGAVHQLLIGGPFQALIDEKPFLTGQINLNEDSLLVSVNRGQPIAKTLQTRAIGFTAQAWPKGLGTATYYIYPDNLNLITLPDGSGQEKLAILTQ